MLSTVENKIAYLLILAIVMVLGYCVVILYALFKNKGVDKISYIKEKGISLSITALKSISTTFFCAVIIWGVIDFILHLLFSVRINNNQGYISFFIVLGLTYIGTLVYDFRLLTIEKETKPV